jgi:erythromycin esterase-like protein/predicted phosphoribosyltransferase
LRESRRGDRLFRDRRDAGRVLAGLLKRYRDRRDVIVLALPRGGVPVADEVAKRLGAPLDVFLVRKLGIPPEVIQQVAEREGRELLRREQAYREGRPPPEVAGRIVVLVDDGLATGASMRAAIQALRRPRPARIVVAVPAAPDSTWRELDAVVDEVVCATTPSPFLAVGNAYWDFSQTADEEVRELLRAASTSRPANAEATVPPEVAVIRRSTLPVKEGVPHDEALFDLVGDARFVLIGEASHGTHEFYAARASMTRRLIEQRGFCAVAVEADWPDAYRANRYVRGRGEDATAEEALRGFERFPTWMWRNVVVLDFVGWLREHNDRLGDDGRAKAGFYGLDLYSLYRSIDEVISYLERVDPAAAARARERYACFDRFSGDYGQSYGFAAAFGAGESCEQEVIEQLVDLQRHALEYARRDGLIAEDEALYAQRNAATVKAAAEYYRSMFGGRVPSWNLRDRHLAETLNALADHLSRQQGEIAKIVVWAHNSHLGDARATEVAASGELNLGQLVRERHGRDCRLIGFTTSTGTVTAADDWGGPAQRKWVRPPASGKRRGAVPRSRKGLPGAVAVRARGHRGAALRPPGASDRCRLSPG